MKRLYIALTFSFFIVACGTPSQPSTAPPTPVPPTQTEAATQPPTDTALPPTEANLEPATFRDDFEDSLAEGWQWLHEDASNWSLTEVPGSLQLNILGGEVSDDSLTNLLLRDAPAGDFQIETKVTVHPQADYQIAGLIIYESPGNFIQAGRAFCDLADTCVGEGLYLDHYEDGNFIVPNITVAYTEEEVYLRLSRLGDSYSFQTSSDGSEWTTRGEITGKINPMQIGLVAAQNTTEPIPAVFDYFEVTSLP